MGILTQNWIWKKSILVFDATLKQMNIGTWNFRW